MKRKASAAKSSRKRKTKAKIKRQAKGSEQARFLARFDSKPTDSIDKIFSNFMRLARTA